MRSSKIFIGCLFSLVMTNVFADLGAFNQGSAGLTELNSEESYIATRAPMISEWDNYIGFNLGATATSFKPTISMSYDPDYPSNELATKNSAVFSGGVYAGTGINFDQLYLGAEVSGSYTSLDKNINTSFSSTTSGNMAVSLKVRQPAAMFLDFIPGYLSQDRKLLLHARLGMAAGIFNSKLNADSDLAPFVNDVDNEVAFGVHAGLGFDYFLLDNLSLRAEYVYTQYQEISGTYQAGVGSAVSYSYKLTAPKSNQINLGLALHF